jgi:hypothetical protein
MPPEAVVAASPSLQSEQLAKLAKFSGLKFPAK